MYPASRSGKSVRVQDYIDDEPQQHKRADPADLETNDPVHHRGATTPGQLFGQFVAPPAPSHKQGNHRCAKAHQPLPAHQVHQVQKTKCAAVYRHKICQALHRPHAQRAQYSHHKAHSTVVAGLKNIAGGDDRFYNNLIIQPGGLDGYDKATLPVEIEGNVYYNGAKPYIKETKHLVKAEFNPEAKVIKKGDSMFLHITLDDSWYALDNRLVTTVILGRAKIPNLSFENPDGTALKIDTDYFGKKRNEAHPSAGPFEIPGEGKLMLKVW